MSKANRYEYAAIWLQGYLTATSATLTVILDDCPMPQKYTRMALDNLAYEDNEGRWHLHQHFFNNVLVA